MKAESYTAQGFFFHCTWRGLFWPAEIYTLYFLYEY